ncbi:helix-turn-helix domain-containing protein [Mesorhizobium sp. BR1-1-6]|uniref:helix-turn-helix domain-containing protein n=1 Tax=Mesorhizobium sp. BR1-1-6 TaxID=2876648 RepID=UPI001CD105FC|nr:helix-turn-helix transcriptional regulator [Mesorhizobium sp. BR1-1-6]MBZ9894211.1 helix-turn-helix domain-containing protein [Mesorhizobium sp. BR1-1-6]
MAKLARPAPKPERRRHFIKQWRKAKHLTQEELAERIGVTPGAISQLELGRVNYTQPMLEAIAAEFGIRPGDLLNVDPTREQAIWSIWETLDVPTRNQVIEIAKTFQKTGTDD